MKRCNEAANLYSTFNGFQVCDDHLQDQPAHDWGYSPNAGKCDQPVETRREFWSRYPESRKYQELFATD